MQEKAMLAVLHKSLPPPFLPFFLFLSMYWG
uniref:Uncharacterized protein n=1 Tax=Rhizophora mucronata TaxID=61149 RepID=A0A2P2PCC0_RHIMU